MHGVAIAGRHGVLVMCAALAGALRGPQMGSFMENDGKPIGCGQLFIALEPEMFSGGAFHDMSRAQFPIQYWGSYFFADLCGGWIRARLSNGTVTTFATGISQPVDLKMSRDGSLYYLARGAGSVGRIQFTSSQPPGNCAMT